MSVAPNAAAPTEPTSQPFLLAKGLSCTRDEIALFEPVNLSLAPGELVLLEGENGVGKTTLLRALLGLVPLSFESLQVGSHTQQHAYRLLPSYMRWLGHASGLKAELSVAENWRFLAALEGEALSQAAIFQWAEKLGLAGFESARVGQLSAGQKKRAQLARLMFGQARMWCLDEPFANVDRAGIRLIEQLIRDFLARGGCVLASSHGVLPFQIPHQTIVLRPARWLD